MSARLFKRFRAFFRPGGAPANDNCSAIYGYQDARVSKSLLRNRLRISRQDQTSNFQSETFYSYQGGRWLWSEEKEMARRLVKFNVYELGNIAAQSVGASRCIRITKLPEGNFNKTILLVMDDGREVIAKIPNPNAGYPHLTTSSEVATMDFVRAVLGIPAPKVHTWSSSNDNPVGAEYIIMEQVAGIELAKVWDEMEERERVHIITEIVDIHKSFAATRFPCYGSLSLNAGTGPSFAVGPSVARSFFDDGRADAATDHGPWSSFPGYCTALAKREMACIRMLPNFSNPTALVCGPGLYHPTKDNQLFALENYLKVAPYLVPKEEFLRASVMWHGDLHMNNIFVDKHQRDKISGIIDWQSTFLAPLCFQALPPPFIDFGELLTTDTDAVPYPPNFASMSAEEQMAATRLRRAKTCFKWYGIVLHPKCQDIVAALDAQDSLPCRLPRTVGKAFDGGEPLIADELVAAEGHWSELVGINGDGSPTIPCPVQFTEEEKAKIKENFQLWKEGVHRMKQVIERLNVHLGWDGWVYHDEYKGMKLKLEQERQKFLKDMAKTPEERVAWERVWPYPPTNAKLDNYPL